jgi:ribosomal protein L16 Arg81 hydroxylase
MRDATMDFESILRPTTPASFFEEHWEKRPLVVERGAPDHFAGLFSRRALDTILWSAPPPWGVVQIANHRRGEGWVDYTSAAPDPGRLAMASAQGDTIVLNDVHLRWAPVAALCRDLTRVFHFFVNVNLYLTPRDAQGLSPHFDTQDVFILQVEGKKRWRLYAPLVHLPQDEDACAVPAEHCRAPSLEVDLKAGDTLYIPRGVVHEALTGEQASMHLTVGISVVSWEHLLAAALSRVSRNDAAFRSPLPVGFMDRADMAALEAQAKALLRRWAEAMDVEGARDRLAARVLETLRPLPGEHFAQAPDLGRVALDTVVRRRAGMVCHVTRDGGAAQIRFPGNVVRGPGPIEPALRFVAGAETFTPRELPGGLHDNAKVVLVRRLTKEGLLQIEAQS